MGFKRGDVQGVRKKESNKPARDKEIVREQEDEGEGECVCYGAQVLETEDV